MSKTHPNLLVITIDTYFCMFDNPEKAEREEGGGGRGIRITNRILRLKVEKEDKLSHTPS